jgi:hypothetical protein
VSRPPLAARFGHVNLVARDWRALARFYTEVFGCVPVPPERDYSGPDLAAGTALPGARLRGVHLRLPGFEAMGDAGPTLEIYTYDSPEEARDEQQGEWVPTDAVPTYVTESAVAVAERGDSTMLCATAADRDHVVLDSSIVDCIDVSDLL